MQLESINAPRMTTLPVAVTARPQPRAGVLIDIALTTGVIVGGVMVPVLLAKGMILGYGIMLDALGWQ